MENKQPEIIRADTATHIAEARKLFQEYAELLIERGDCESKEVFQEIPKLPNEYASPDGVLLLAIMDDSIAGCVALRRLEPEVCEMKRLYARPTFRGKGVGRSLILALIEEAKQKGYIRMRLDTIPPLKEAILLYESLGFKRIERYNKNPFPDAIFMEINLKSE